MAKYDPSYSTTVSADASSYGLGAVLLQDQPTGERRAVAYASRSLTSTEQRYSQTEKEALAATWAVERFDQFVRGIKFDIESDHRPLLTLLGTAELDLIPPRIQRLRMRLMRYQYRMLYVPGKLLATADTLSRAPLGAATKEHQGPKVDSVELFISEVVKGFEDLTSSRLESLRQHQAQDGVCAGLLRLCESGWPEKVSKVPNHLRGYWKVRGSITVYDGLLLKDRCIIIPPGLRKDMLQLIHEGHQGIGRCKARARDAVWWPTVNSEIEQLVTGCERCAQTRVQRSEPLLCTPTPNRPWQRVGIDLFELSGRHYVLIVDYYSRFPEVVSLTSTSSTAVIAAVKSSFARFGIPDVVVSDNGPQFSSREFAAFASCYGFHHATSSPRYPQANGEAERMVRTMKELFFKSQDPHMSLLVYRDTPGISGYSPSQLLFGRRLQTRVPKLDEALIPTWPSQEDFQRKDKAARGRQQRDFNRRHRVQRLRSLSVGEDVWVDDISCAAKVLSPAKRPRSYVVETPSGVIQRNRRHLVPFDASDSQQQNAGPVQETSGNSGVVAQNSEESMLSPSSRNAHRPPQTVSSDDVQRGGDGDSAPPRTYFTRSGRRVKAPVKLNL
ncbi:Integrase core domain protein [Anaplasma phagocytophilum]|nr:Integrase core domain protein [Anaplasma phagocytophilum]